MKRNVKWKWINVEQEAFDKLEGLTKSSKVLTHFDTMAPLTISCDTSTYSISAVLAQRFSDGFKKPISITNTQWTRKELFTDWEGEFGLSLGLRNFILTFLDIHLCCIWIIWPWREEHPSPGFRPNTMLGINTSVKWVYHIFSSNTSMWIQMLWVAYLNITIPIEPILLMKALQSTTIIAPDISEWIRKDALFSEAYNYIQLGWPDNIISNLKPFVSIKYELSTMNGYI